MAITNEEAIKYSNEQIRPISEKMRNLYYECKSMQADWFNGANLIIPNDSKEMLEDLRVSDSDLSGADITNFITQVSNYIALVEGAGVLGVISKPCVRPLEV